MAPKHRLNFASVFALSIMALLPLASGASLPQPDFQRHYGVGRTNFSVQAVPDKSVTPGAAAYWLESVPKQGRAAFNPNPSEYRVFRNVKDYGATGDGVTDDTAAINAAIQEGSRCGNGCDSSTVTPALVYFPAGTYRVSSPIVAMYYSQLVGDPTNRPTIKGLPNFSGISLIDSDPYNPDGTNWYTNQNNFFRSVRNLIVDTTDMPAQAGTGIHWQVAQASSLVNLKFVMSQAANNSHQGIFMDNGSGGFMSDLEFVGGKYGAFLGNQQFLTRNMVFRNCQTAIFVNWDWQWTFKSLDIANCGIGIDFSGLGDTGAQNVGSVIVMDSKIANTPIGIKTSRSGNSQPISGGSCVLDNVSLSGVRQAVASARGTTILAGGTFTIDLWGQGRTYNTDGSVQTIQNNMHRSFAKPTALLDASGKVFERSRPLYQNVPASRFISARSHGAKGDGTTDDTAALRKLFATYGGKPGHVIFLDHGVYLVSNTIQIPVGTRIVGEVWSVIMAAGAAFQDRNNPKPVWRVGNPGDKGTVEMQDLLFQTRGPQPGAILMQWHSRDPDGHQGKNALWDVHFRVAGSRGTQLEVAQCLKAPTIPVGTPNPQCEVSFMLLHIAKTASVYIENCWAWTSDHALDRPFDQITVYNGRGILTESKHGPVWMYAAAAEHNTLYQYQLRNTQNVFMAVIQSETPYFQSNPGAQVPFQSLAAWGDPDYGSCTTATCRKSWALRILNSRKTLIYGAGLYSFFENYSQDCIATRSCQDSIVEIRNSPDVTIFNLNTIASKSMMDYNGRKIISADDNLNTFCQTVMEFSTS